MDEDHGISISSYEMRSCSWSDSVSAFPLCYVAGWGRPLHLERRLQQPGGTDFALRRPFDMALAQSKRSGCSAVIRSQ